MSLLSRIIYSNRLKKFEVLFLLKLMSFFVTVTLLCSIQSLVHANESSEIVTQAIYDPAFYRPFLLNKLNPAKAAGCAKKFRALCGTEYIPHFQKFTLCLQKNFNTFSNDNACKDFAHAFVHSGFLTNLLQEVSQCQVRVESCYKFGKENISSCFQNQKNLPGICVKLMVDAKKYRDGLIESYGVDFFKTSPN